MPYLRPAEAPLAILHVRQRAASAQCGGPFALPSIWRDRNEIRSHDDSHHLGTVSRFARDQPVGADAQQLRDLFKNVKDSVVTIRTEEKTVATSPQEGTVSMPGLASGVIASSVRSRKDRGKRNAGYPATESSVPATKKGLTTAKTILKFAPRCPPRKRHDRTPRWM
jgi:hypothetical protein